MEMIIWLLPIILTNQAYQLHTSRLSGCLWGFLFYYLNLIKQLIAGPYVPFHTIYPWSEKQQLYIYLILFYGCAAVKPHRAEGSVPFSASSCFKYWENTRDIFIYRCTCWGANTGLHVNMYFTYLFGLCLKTLPLCAEQTQLKNCHLFCTLTGISKHRAETQWSPCRKSDKIQA